MSTDTGFAQSLDIALGSVYEVETQLQISKNVGFLSEEVYADLAESVQSLERQISSLISKIRH